MERLDTSLHDILNDTEAEDDCQVRLEPEDVAALYFQTLFAILTYQSTLQLKHHDLHTKNVFIKTLDEHTLFRGQLLTNATHFHYNLNGVNYYLPNSGLLVKIADFGLSTGYRVERIDMDIFNDDPLEWGHWNASLVNQRGYDTQVLFAQTPFDRDTRFQENQPLARLLQRLRKNVFGKNGKISRTEKRPMPGCVSDVPPARVIHNVFNKTPEDWYNFTNYPVPMYNIPLCIITLGDSDWFSPAIEPQQSPAAYRVCKLQHLVYNTTMDLRFLES